MQPLIRGKYVLTSATHARVLTDAAVRVSGDLVAEVGDWATLSALVQRLAGRRDEALLRAEQPRLMRM